MVRVQRYNVGSGGIFTAAYRKERERESESESEPHAAAAATAE